jgi:hypothetical protein
MRANPPLSQLMREAEAARRLGTSVRTLQKWRCNGKGPRFVRLGRSVRYDPADLEACIARGRRTSTSDTGEPPTPATRPTEPSVDGIVAWALRSAGVTPANRERAATGTTG